MQDSNVFFILLTLMNFITVISNLMLIHRQLKLENALERALAKNNQLLEVIAKQHGWIK